MDVRTAAGQLAANFFVATPARVLFERAARDRPFIRAFIKSRIADASRFTGIRGESSSSSFFTPFTSILSVLTGGGEDATNGLLHVAHASLWTISVPFIQSSIIESAKDLLFGGYTLYGRMREALNPDFRPFLYAEIMRPVTFAAKTVAYAASFPFFLCAYGVRNNKPEHWNKIPASFLPSRKKAIPTMTLPLFVLIAHLNAHLLAAGGLRDLFFRLRVRLLPSTVAYDQALSPRAQQFLHHVEDLALCLAAGAITVPLEVLLCTMLATRSGLASSVSAIWKEKGLGGFFSGFGWYLLAQYLTTW